MREKILHFLLHIGQFIFIVRIVFFFWLSIRVMNFNKNNIDRCSKYTSQHRCNYRDPPPIISSPVRQKKNQTNKKTPTQTTKTPRIIIIYYCSEYPTLYLTLSKCSGVSHTIL